MQRIKNNKFFMYGVGLGLLIVITMIFSFLLAVHNYDAGIGHDLPDPSNYKVVPKNDGSLTTDDGFSYHYNKSTDDDFYKNVKDNSNDKTFNKTVDEDGNIIIYEED